MAWQTVPGLSGKVYIPEERSKHKKKHQCPDCFDCQQCSDDRCTVCRADGENKCRPNKRQPCAIREQEV